MKRLLLWLSWTAIFAGCAALEICILHFRNLTQFQVEVSEGSLAIAIIAFWFCLFGTVLAASDILIERALRRKSGAASPPPTT